MAHYAVRESPPLRGEIPISTSKNAVLPIMCGALLTSEDVRIDHLPDLSDVHTLSALLEACGCRLKREGGLTVNGDGHRNIDPVRAGDEIIIDFPDKEPVLTPNGDLKIPIVFEETVEMEETKKEPLWKRLIAAK